MSETPITAIEIKRELTKQLQRQRNGNAPRWAVFDELRLGTGFTSDRRNLDIRFAKSDLAGFKRLRKRGEKMLGDLVIEDRIAELEEKIRDRRHGRDPRESRMDLFAIDCWPGKGAKHERRAYEVKVSASDLHAELNNPAKRAPWLEMVNRFFIVIPKRLASVSLIEERAPECGLLYYTRLPKRPGLKLCDCERDTGSSLAPYLHERDCAYRAPAEAYEKAVRGRRINVARPAMDLGGGEPSWGFVASILRAAATG